ncbi:tenascin-R-like [Lytechinus variegatus]|uniref:tenascin-R-like n=1 Tax=Lytechinus variegatus TaxID=7654 RepID=UPI001BB25401|nr:tenascin-R-like [Lytechinus variegatus]
MARFLSIYFVLLMVSYRDATDGETVPFAPENVRILDEYTTLSSLRVAWDHPTPSPSVEHFYQIRYRTVLSASASMDVGSDATTSTISGLETNTLYVINVLSAVDDEDGYIQFSTILAESTLYGRTGGAQPGDIFLRKLTSDSLECEFEPLQSNVIHYLNFTVGDRSNPSVRSVNDPHSTWAIYGLTPGETYRMVLGVDGMTGQEKWVTTIPLPPENVRVVSYTPTTLTIAWDPPAQGTGDSPPIVHSYQVEVFPTDIIVKVNSTVTEVTIEDLHSGSSYGISVKSLAGVNEAGNEVKKHRICHLGGN